MLRPAAIAVTLLAALILPAPVAAQQVFQGAITFRMQMEGMTATMTMRSKGAKTRTDMEIPGMPGGIFMVMDLDSMVMHSVMPEMGMYMSMDMKTVMESAAGLLPLDSLRASMANTTFEALGTSDTLAGVPCQNYRLSQGQDQSEMCVATGLGNLGGGSTGLESSIPGLEIDISAYAKEFPNGMLPLRIRMRRNGTWETTMEATVIDRTPLDDAIFAIPPGLSRVEPPTD